MWCRQSFAPYRLPGADDDDVPGQSASTDCLDKVPVPGDWSDDLTERWQAGASSLLLCDQMAG